MLFLGHLGIGSKLVDVFRTELPKRWLLLGTVLPDLIDKPLYYFAVILTGQTGAAAGLISGTRTFGHTGLLLLVIAGFALGRGSLPLFALTAGMLTHLGLDLMTESWEYFDHAGIARAVLFPFLGFDFWSFPSTRMPAQAAMVQHFASKTHSYFIWITEGAGFLLLSWDLTRHLRKRGQPQGAALRKNLS